MEITEKQLIEAGKTTLYDLVARRINGFHVGNTFKESMFTKVAYHPDGQALVVGINMVADIIVDGQATSLFSANNEPPYDNPNPQAAIDFMKSMSADNVKSVKLGEGTKLFIVVTTRGGHGFFTKSSYNIVAYRPIPYCMPKQFYRPKYDVKNTAPTVPRPTVHWEPNVITDSTGKTNLSFYAADKPGTYTVIVEGTDMQGNFGRHVGKIVIGATAPKDKKVIGK
ncbi:hypothetical protein [Mucilaginibacter pedocola]|uniref:Uncharacterized protein n=1 Tax=Mucilaginibacter pedocola TaxID=1792845 RepID=A0A1S9PEL0_9SPHI|nr:hypothetical protein [Mucilaginibacter pedocola]OOQ59383.1 hypothetical protein BC343_28245 [Mucilaginibacter pedocola]